MIALRRVLTELLQETTPLVVYLSELASFAPKLNPVELCGWLDGMHHHIETARSQTTALDHMLDVLWEQASREAERRRV